MAMAPWGVAPSCSRRYCTARLNICSLRFSRSWCVASGMEGSGARFSRPAAALPCPPYAAVVLWHAVTSCRVASCCLEPGEGEVVKAPGCNSWQGWSIMGGSDTLVVPSPPLVHTFSLWAPSHCNPVVSNALGSALLRLKAAGSHDMLLVPGRLLAPSVSQVAVINGPASDSPPLSFVPDSVVAIGDGVAPIRVHASRLFPAASPLTVEVVTGGHLPEPVTLADNLQYVVGRMSPLQCPRQAKAPSRNIGWWTPWLCRLPPAYWSLYSPSDEVMHLRAPPLPPPFPFRRLWLGEPKGTRLTRLSCCIASPGGGTVDTMTALSCVALHRSPDPRPLAMVGGANLHSRAHACAAGWLNSWVGF
jgi:hypothetical protein